MKFSAKLKLISLFATSVSVLLCSVGFAGALSEEDKLAISAAFTKNFPQITVDTVAESVFEGVYELTLDNGEVVFVNKAADHLLVNAKLLQIKGPGQVVDVLENRKSAGRKDIIQSLGSEEAVTFKGEGETTTPLYVFTDVECGYCRKLHEEVPALQKAGIDVHYFAWPRAGVESSAGSTMHNIWCAKDTQTAMTAAKTGGKVADAEKGCISPLAEQLKLGLQLGVAGTPAIFTANGQQIGGYAKAADLIKTLEQLTP